jgi:hypothetical protein
VSPAPEIFMHCANTVAARDTDVPPFATYHVHTDFHFLKKDTAFEKTISVRLADQVALVHDETTNTGKNGDVDFRVSNVEPIRYEESIRRDATMTWSHAQSKATPSPSSTTPAIVRST